ncbi:endopolygalacturonase [Opitutaceae bacterium TAV1]|nr:endopolygalacturonase [Opitutaceae bacterium TAV1]
MNPPLEPPSADFRVTINGMPAFVHQARVSAVPFNRVWPGHQRSLDQTEIASFVSFDADFGSFPVTVRIDVLDRFSDADLDHVEIRPAGYGIRPIIDRQNRTLTFTLAQPRHLTVEINGWHHALHLFANPLAAYTATDIRSPDTLHFGPGIHHAGLILPRSGQTIHIAEGAIVYGAILVHRADNVRILGRGILDSGPYHRGEQARENEPGGELLTTGLAAGLPRENINYLGNIAAIESRHLTIDGIILRDAPLWSMNIRNGCHDVTINNVKIIGQWRYNADGINLCTSSRVHVSNCFVRSFDDCIIARGVHMLGEHTPVNDVRVTDCVLWCDWGRALEVWTGYKSARISNVVFENIHIIRTNQVALDLLTWWGGSDTTVSDIRFENIFVETDPHPLPPVMQENDAHRYPHPVSLPPPRHCPKLFSATLNDPGESWKSRLFRDHAYDPARRNVVFKNILVKNVHFAAPASCDSANVAIPESLVGKDDPALHIQDICFENIRINGQKAQTLENLRLSVRGDVTPPALR